MPNMQCDIDLSVSDDTLIFADAEMEANNPMHAMFQPGSGASQVITIDPVKLGLSPDTIGRYAGGGRYVVKPDMQASVAAAREKALQLASPVLAYGIFALQGFLAGGRPCIKDNLFLPISPAANLLTDCISAGVLTLGPALEEQVTRLVQDGDMLGALFLDAAGVALLEAAVCEALAAINHNRQLAGYIPSCYRQPGCDDIPMETQKILFQLVDAEAAGVVLSESCVMVPAKSLSFWIEWSREPTRAISLHKCRNCSLRNCMFRRRLI